MEMEAVWHQAMDSNYIVFYMYIYGKCPERVIKEYYMKHGASHNPF
jgi:hypothetical protein